MTAIDRLVHHARQAPHPVREAPSRPRTGTAIVTCMDARIDVFSVFGLRPGDAHVVRNAGGRVTAESLADIRLSRDALGTTEVLLLHHEGCAALPDPAADLAEALTALRAEPAVDPELVRGFIYRLDGTLDEPSPA